MSVFLHKRQPVFNLDSYASDSEDRSSEDEDRGDDKALLLRLLATKTANFKARTRLKKGRIPRERLVDKHREFVRLMRSELAHLDPDRTNAEVMISNVVKNKIADVVDVLLESPRAAQMSDTNGESLLHHAVSNDRSELVKILLNSGADPNAADVNGITPMHLVMYHRRMDIFSSLLRHGGDFNITDQHKVRPIHWACEFDFVQALKLIIRLDNVNRDVPDVKGQRPVHYCCLRDADRCLKRLLDAGASIYQPTKNKNYTIHMAIFRNSTKCVKLLLEHDESHSVSAGLIDASGLASALMGGEADDGAGDVEEDPLNEGGGTLVGGHLLNLVDSEGFRPLHTAIISGENELVKLCLAKEADIYAAEWSGKIPFHYAAIRGDIDCVKLLIQHNNGNPIDKLIEYRDKDGRMALHYSAMHNHMDMTLFLLENGSPMDPVDINGLTPLMLASLKGAVKVAIKLIELGGDVMTCDTDHRSLGSLFLISEAGEAREVVGPLAKTGRLTDIINIADKWGCNAMHIASRMGLRVAQMHFINFQCNALARDIQGRTPLHSAAQFGRYQICEILLNSSIGIRALNKGDHEGRLPLHLAARYGQNRVLDLLIYKGSSFHRCHSGNTPLHYAAMEGDVETCQLLLDINSSMLNSTNVEGATALHIAARNENINVMDYLILIGAKLLPDSHGNYFTTDAIVNLKYSTVNSIVRHSRWQRIWEELSGTEQCPVAYLIRYIPSLCMVAMDRYVTEYGVPSKPGYGTKFDFDVLQPKSRQDVAKPEDPLKLIKLMVKLKREQLLTHILASRYLRVKWNTYGRWIQVFIIFYYGLMAIVNTAFALHQMPLGADYGDKQVVKCMRMIYSRLEPRPKEYWLCILVLFLTICTLTSKLSQLAIERLAFFRDWNNCLVVFIMLLNLANCIVTLLGKQGPHSVAFGALIVLFSGLNFLLQLVKVHHIGIYVVMFIQVATSLMKTLPIFFVILISFTVTFYRLFYFPDEQAFLNLPVTVRDKLIFCFTGFEHLNRSRASFEKHIDDYSTLSAFSDLRLSFFQTLMMMVGEYEHTPTLIEAYLDDQASTLYNPELTFGFMIAFVLLVPICLMNLMLGLAVGDINKVRKTAKQHMIAQQVNWLDNIERRLPVFIYQRVCKKEFIEHPAVTYRPAINKHAYIYEIQQMRKKFKVIGKQIEAQTSKLTQIASNVEYQDVEGDPALLTFVDEAIEEW